MISAIELAAALRPELIRAPTVGPMRFRRAVVDSRHARRGDLYFALKGERADGHDFVADAARHGAAGAVVERPVDAEIAQYVVRDVLGALQQLARQRRASRPRLKVIGVTGSVGKTTTKEIIAALLATRYRVLKNEGNLNSEIGLPLVLLELTTRHQRAVLEMGMWAQGEMALLCDIARPQIGVVTMVGPVHMERLGTISAIEREKGELPASLPPDGVAVLNADDERVAGMAARTRAHVMTFGFGAGADVRAEDIEPHGFSGTRFTLVHGDGREHVYTHLPGRALVANALAAAAVGIVDGLSLAEVGAALSETRPPARFSVLRASNGATIIDDTYNASPASMHAALDLLAGAPGRKVAVLGDMLELGAAESESHAEVGRAAALVADTLYAVGPRGRMIGAAAIDAGLRDVHISEAKDGVAAAIARDLGEGDTVLVKASRGLALETVARELAEDA